LTSTLEPKRFGLLRELVPQAATIAVLLNPNWPPAAKQLRDMQGAAHTIGMQTHIVRASTDSEIDTAFESVAQLRIPALAVASDSFFNSRRDKLAVLATHHAVPAMYSLRDYAVAGGLMSYGTDLLDVYRQVGVYAGRILKGAKPAELPVVQPTKFEFDQSQNGQGAGPRNSGGVALFRRRGYRVSNCHRIAARSLIDLASSRRALRAPRYAAGRRLVSSVLRDTMPDTSPTQGHWSSDQC
jgi:hypothetical protein